MKRRVTLWWVVILAVLVGSCTPKVEVTTTTATAAPTAPTTTTRPAILTGAGIADGTIMLAGMLPLSGTLETFGRSLLAGHEVYWEYVNGVLGGVGGTYPVRFVPFDTVYDEDTARSVWAANQDDVLAVSSVLGSPITEALLAEVGDERILISAGSQASSWSASPNVVLNLALPTYRDQIAGSIVAGGAEEPVVAMVPPLGLMYQEGAFGNDCLTGFEQATSRYVADETVASGHAGTTTEFAADLTLMQQAAVQTLFVCTSSQALLRIVATLDVLDYGPTLVVTSQSYDASLPAALGGDGGETAGLASLDNVFVVGSLPPFEGDAPGTKLMVDNLARSDAAAELVDQWFFLGYTQAATFHLILEEAFSGGDLTRDGVWVARDRLGEVDFGFGAGPSGFDDDRVPVVADVLSVPAPSTESRFGMVPVGGYYSTR